MDGDLRGVPYPAAGSHRLDVLLGRIRTLQRARQAAARELAEAQGRSEGLRRHLEQLEEHQSALEGLWQQKQEALRVARLHREEVEAEGQRHRGLCLGRQQDLEGAGQQRGHLRHLRRAHRQEFWRQLDDIMEEHKHLREAHAPAQLAAELVRLEEAQEQLLSQERHLLEAEEQLGPEAHVAARLVEEEEEGVKRRLEAELGRRQACQNRRDRLEEELERLQRPLEAPPE
ncbi:synaptonemal complex central element protein 1 [Grus americana]|uniref:synaptonemal complex central element protein 1 n=1 Tax=Grus americana TaxID=9117 RepID=UPI0024078DFF|nr:synaptonemal complex central element protein 1 [Grus americana]